MSYATRLRQNALFRTTYWVFAAATILNFIAFVVISSRIGGDAVNGKVEGGRYYVFGVATRDGRKVYTEVSERVYTYSRWQVYSILSTWPLMMVGGLFLQGKVLSSRPRLPTANG